MSLSRQIALDINSTSSDGALGCGLFQACEENDARGVETRDNPQAILPAARHQGCFHLDGFDTFTGYTNDPGSSKRRF